MTSVAALAISAGLAVLSATPASATGTLADTLVSNTVTVDYAVGGVSQDQVSATETFKVDTMIDVQVTATDDTVVPGETEDTAVLTYVIENQGNDTQGYDLDVIYTDGGIGLTPSADATVTEGEYALFIDNGDGIFDPATDTFYDPTGTTNGFDLAPDATATVFVVAEIPSGSTDTETASFDVVATTLDAGTANVTAETATPGIDTTDTVFVDDAGSATGDIAEDGEHSDGATFTVQSADMTIAKTATVISRDPAVACATATQDTDANELFAIPGACIEYTITVSNTGSTAIATDVAISDSLPSDITFVAIHSSTDSDFSSGETGDVAPAELSGTVSATEATLDPGQSINLVIRATIN